MSINSIRIVSVPFLFLACVALAQDVAELVKKGQKAMMEEDFKTALVIFSKVIELDPKNAQAYGSRGTCNSVSGKPEEALADFKKAIELNPKEATFYNDRSEEHTSELQSH